jgi:spermidine/putrescine-binding protein
MTAPNTPPAHRAGLTRRRLLGGAAALGAGLAAPALIAGRARAEAYDGTAFDARGETLRLAMWGGTFEAALREHVIPEFEATFNAKV